MNLFSFYLSGNIIFWSFRFSVLFLFVMTCGCRRARSDCFLFSFVQRSSSTSFAGRVDFILFYGARLIRGDFSFLSCAGRVGRNWCGIFLVNMRLNFYILSKKGFYLLFSLIGREWQLFWIWFRVRLFHAVFYSISIYNNFSGFLENLISLVPSFWVGLVLSPISFIHFRVFQLRISLASFSVSCFSGPCKHLIFFSPFDFSFLVFISAVAAVWHIRFRAESFELGGIPWKS